MSTWPLSLPQVPDGDGYGETPAYNVIEAPVGGPSLARRQYTTPILRLSAPFRMTRTQLGVFEAFYDADMGGGSLPFQWRRRGDPAEPIRDFRCVASPNIEYLGGIYWRVTLSLVQLP